MSGFTSGVQRYAAIVEYNGACFHGWQKQKHHNEPTIQAALEAAISKVANHPVEIACAGRTDAGVHATRQVIHFDSHAVRTEYSWLGLRCSGYRPLTLSFMPVSKRARGVIVT